jgi:hypothetical protein
MLHIGTVLQNSTLTNWYIVIKRYMLHYKMVQLQNIALQNNTQTLRYVTPVGGIMTDHRLTHPTIHYVTVLI